MHIDQLFFSRLWSVLNLVLSCIFHCVDYFTWSWRSAVHHRSWNPASAHLLRTLCLGPLPIPLMVSKVCSYAHKLLKKSLLKVLKSVQIVIISSIKKCQSILIDSWYKLKFLTYHDLYMGFDDLMMTSVWLRCVD